MAERVCPECGSKNGWNTDCATCRDGLRELVGSRPTDEDVKRAEQIARERGWLTDEGWIWEAQ